MVIKRGIVILILVSTVITMFTFGEVSYPSYPITANTILTEQMLNDLYNNIKTLTDYIESDASGNIGIGDVTAEDPSTKLDLYTGDLRVRDMAGCSGRLITDGSGIVQCNTDAIVTTETDPEVGDVSSADLWCRSDGASVQCDQPNPTSSGGAPYSMMYLRANAGGTPATCPVDWIEADYTSEYAGSSVTNNVRTCYISDKCSVMYLRANAGGTPATCPVDWIEADYTSEYAGSSLTNNVRTCYVCS